MDPSSSHTLQTDDETRVLGALLEAFHPFLSLQEIASAYCRAGSDLYKASEILCQLKESNTNIVHHENDNGMKTTQSEESVCGDNTKDSNYFCNNKILKPKKQSATVGTVSTILGKSYARPTSTKKEMVEATKPLKLEVKGSSADELETGYVKIEEHSDHRDMEDFLFSMLGDGFKLSKDVIREVLGDFYFLYTQMYAHIMHDTSYAYLYIYISYMYMYVYIHFNLTFAFSLAIK